MRSKAAVLFVLLFIAGLFAPGLATAAGCADYRSQAAAQQRLRGNPSDPEGLDVDGDGIACENNPAPFDRSPVNRATPGQSRSASPEATRHPYLGPTPAPLSALQ